MSRRNESRWQLIAIGPASLSVILPGMLDRDDNQQRTSTLSPLRWQVEGRGRTLVIHWSDGRNARIEAETLWRHCPSAFGKRRRMDNANTPAPGLVITATQPIGGYGVNIAFSDGHDRGIYTWALLASLAELPGVTDFIANTSCGDNDNALSTSRSGTQKGAD